MKVKIWRETPRKEYTSINFRIHEEDLIGEWTERIVSKFLQTPDGSPPGIYGCFFIGDDCNRCPVAVSWKDFKFSTLAPIRDINLSANWRYTQEYFKNFFQELENSWETWLDIQVPVILKNSFCLVTTKNACGTVGQLEALLHQELKGYQHTNGGFYGLSKSENPVTVSWKGFSYTSRFPKPVTSGTKLFNWQKQTFREIYFAWKESQNHG